MSLLLLFGAPPATITGTTAVTLANATSAAAGAVGLVPGNAQATSVTAAGTTGITVTKPTDVIDGDVMYAFVGRSTFANNAAWTCSGWTDIGPAAANAGTTVGNDRQMTLLRKVVTSASGEPANYTFVNTQATSYQIVGIIINVHGASTTTPEDAAIPAYNLNSDDATPASRNVTSITAGALVIQYCQLSLGATTPVTPGAPSTYTLVTGGNTSETAGGANDIQCVTAYKVLGAAGSTAGTNVWTHTPDDATTETLIACVAIRDVTASVSGTLAVTLANATSASDGTVGDTGTVAVTLGAVTSAAAGTYGDVGTLAVTLADATLAAAGASGAAGTLAVTLGNATSAAAGGSGTSGTLAVTLGNATLAATGSEVTAELAVTLADITASAAGGQGVGGTLDVTLDNVTSTATGGGVAGTASGTLEITCAAVGVHTEQIADDPFPVKCTIRRQQFGRKFRYHRHAERPAIAAWAFDARDALIDFSDASYTFMFRIGNPGTDALLEKTNNIVGAVGTGETTSGTPNVTINWEPGELDIEPGTYACQLIASRSTDSFPGPDILPPPPIGGTPDTIDVVYHGQIQILALIN